MKDMPDYKVQSEAPVKRPSMVFQILRITTCALFSLATASTVSIKSSNLYEKYMLGKLGDALNATPRYYNLFPMALTSAIGLLVILLEGIGMFYNHPKLLLTAKLLYIAWIVSLLITGLTVVSTGSHYR